MAVTDLTNLWSNVDTVTSNYTPGQGSEGLQSDIKLQGTQSFEKRVDNTSRAVGVSPDGTGSPTSPVNLNGRHVCIFYLTITPDILDNLSVLVYDGSQEETHCVVDTENVIITDGSEYDFPQTGGWIPFWADVDRVGETAGDLSGSGPTNTSAVTHLGHYSTIGNIGGGNLANTYLDAVRYSNSDAGDNKPALYAITGTTTNTIEDLRTAEQNTTTGYRGLLVTRDGVDFFFGRLLIGRTSDITGTTATTFSVTDESFFFVSQRTMQSDWLGWTIDLGNASSTFSMTNCNFQSDRVTDAPVRPDFQVLGTSGTGSITDCAILGLRNFAKGFMTMTGGSLDSVALSNGTRLMTNVNITSRAASGTAMGENFLFDGSSDAIRDCTAKPAGTSFGHFVEFTTDDTANGSARTFNNMIFEDEYLGVTTGTITATGNNNACVYNSSGGTVTINVLGGSIPTVRNSVGSTTVIVESVTVTISGLLGNTEVSVLENPSPYTQTLAEQQASSGPVSLFNEDFVSAVTGTDIEVDTQGTANVTQIISSTTDFTNMTGLVSGDFIRVTERVSGQNLRTFDTFEVVSVAANVIDVVNVASSTLNQQSIIDTTGDTITVEKIDASYTFAVPNGEVVDILLFRVGSLPIFLLNQTISSTNNSFPVSQTLDRNFEV